MRLSALLIGVAFLAANPTQSGAAIPKSVLLAGASFTTSVAVIHLNENRIFVKDGVAVDRTLGDYPLTVKFKTRDGSATSRGPLRGYKTTVGKVRFEPWDDTKDLSLDVQLTDNAEVGKWFFVDLFPPCGSGPAKTIKVFIGPSPVCNGPASTAGFLQSETCQSTYPLVQHTLMPVTGQSNVPVHIINVTRDGTAKAGIDYDPLDSLVMIEPDGSNYNTLVPLAVLKDSATIGSYYYVDLISTDSCCAVTLGTIKVTICPF